MKSGVKRIITGCALSAAILAAAATVTYTSVIPALISNRGVINRIENIVKKSMHADLTIENPRLTTGLNPDIAFTLDKISLAKDNKELLNITGVDTAFSFSEIFSQKLIVKKVLAENVYIDTAGLISLFPAKEEKKETKSSGINVDIFSALLGVKKCLITYNNSDISIKFDAKNIVLDRTRDHKNLINKKSLENPNAPIYPLHFDVDFEMAKGNDKISVSANDKNRIYMGGGELHVDKFPITIDKSAVIIDIFASKKHGAELNIASRNFSARDIYNILTSNIILPNGKELLAPIVDVNGSVDFNLNLTKNNIRGDVNVNESEFKIKDLLNLPVKITRGIIEIGNKDIILRDFKGFYNNKQLNSIKMDGEIKDYWKTCDTKVISDIFVNDDFFKNYVSKLLGAPVDLVGDAGSRLTLTSKNGSCDIVWYFLLNEGEGFKLGEQSMVLEKYKTLFKLDMSIVKNILKINTIDYYITDKLQKGMTPVLAIKGNLDMADNMKLLDISLNIPRPLPSEFLNFLACQKIFRKGTVSGNLSIDNNGEFPKMAGVISFDKVFVPAQRLYIKSAKIGAKGDKLGAIAEGRFKRTKYDFNGYIVNDLRLPIIVKSVNLTVDNVDLERMLAANNSNTHNTEPAKQALESDSPTEEITEENLGDDNAPTFTKGLIIVEKCMLHLGQGKYKQVNFGNLHANLTLDRDGVLEVQSNKFDIAEGISTLKVRADLIKKLYYLRLGIKDVNSDVMAGAVLGLPREISGKARGLIEINTDESLKLNGDIKFDIQNGTIEKVGYVEYLLKAASLFRNPIAMISPTTIGDLVSIPDGSFDVIGGELKLKDNVIMPMRIKSSASELATYIVGRYDLMTNDASLRIYTKFSDKDTGFAGFLRNISLNSLANRISHSGRNDANYYASELSQIPELKVGEKDAQVFLTTVEGDVINFNFLSSLKRIR